MQFTAPSETDAEIVFRRLQQVDARQCLSGVVVETILSGQHVRIYNQTDKKGNIYKTVQINDGKIKMLGVTAYPHVLTVVLATHV